MFCTANLRDVLEEETMFNKTKFNLLLALVFVMSIVLTACGGGASESAVATSYIAKIADAPASARVGIVVENGKFAVYVCSLDDAFNLKSARWYSGDVASDGSVSGVSPDGVQFQGVMSGDTFTGTITNAEGRLWTFSGSAVPAGGPAGLYRGIAEYNGQEVVVGAVVDPDGSFASTVQVRGEIAFITPVAGAPLRVDDTNIKVTIGDPGQQIAALLVTTLVGVELF
jgi:hypothetical protein